MSESLPLMGRSLEELSEVYLINKRQNVQMNAKSEDN